MRFFLEAAGGDAGLSPSTRIVSIGPVTSETLREHGLMPTSRPQPHDVDGVLEAHHRRRRGEGRELITADGRTAHQLLSDYGLGDEFVGVCHGVIAQRCPRARVIDITHAIPRHDVSTGALVLRDALAFVPPAVHLAVVDPDVGAVGAHARRGVAVATADERSMLVGPDNGLLMAAAERLGGPVEAVDLISSPQRLQPVSSHLPRPRHLLARCRGARVRHAARCGRRAAGARGATAPGAHARAVADGELVTHVLRTDHFGNLSSTPLTSSSQRPACRSARCCRCVPGRDSQRALRLDVRRGARR